MQTLTVEQVARLITINAAVKHINEAIEVLNKHDKWTFSAFSPIRMLEEKRYELCQEAIGMAGYQWRSHLNDYATA